MSPSPPPPPGRDAAAALSIAVAILVAVMVILLGAAAPAHASAQHPTLKELEPLVMCPTCGTTIDRSTSPAAERERAWIRARIADGWTRKQILDGLVQEYGGDESILAAPPRSGFTGRAAWYVPSGVLLLALLSGGLVVRGWIRRGRQASMDASRP